MAFASASACPAASAAYELMARGRKSAAALEALLQGALALAPGNAPRGGPQLQELAAQILRCCDRALAALHSEGAVDDAAARGCASRRRRPPPGAAAQTRNKRSRKVAEVPTKVVTRSTPEDGLLWRKYGQKEIQNRKYPRLYYRCSYKEDNGCRATRQVQQSEDDPSTHVITYFGEHTSGMDAAADDPVADAEKMQQLVISFGSGTASGGSPWLCSSSDDDAQSKAATPLPSQAGWFPEEDVEGNMCREEPAMAAPPADWPSSQDLEVLLRYFDSDYFAESSFHMVDGFINL